MEKQEIRIVALEPMRVVSAHGFGASPEAIVRGDQTQGSYCFICPLNPHPMPAPMLRSLSRIFTFVAVVVRLFRFVRVTVIEIGRRQLLVLFPLPVVLAPPSHLEDEADDHDYCQSQPEIHCISYQSYQIEPLAQLARKFDAKVNLIPYNAVEGLPWRRPSDEVQEKFLAALEQRKVPATLRREKGHDIDAACGQLRLRTERMLANSPR